MATAIRILTMDAVEKSSSGHPGMPMGMADVATVLFSQFLKYAPWDPHWPDRDRFVLSAGHGSLLLYSLLYLTGYAHMTLEQLRNFRQWHSNTPGHPEHGPGIEATTGPLAQGLANAVGMALAEKMLQLKFGKDCVDHYTYVMAGDGCLMEGLSQEAISLAGHWQLSKLIVFFDDNGITIDGPVHASCSDDVAARFRASRWTVLSIDGHNFQEIENAIQQAQKHTTPTLIQCRTFIGYGAPNKQGKSIAHGAPLGAEEVNQARKFLNWSFQEPFFVPEDIIRAWKDVGNRCDDQYKNWQKYMHSFPLEKEFQAGWHGKMPDHDIANIFNDLKSSYEAKQPIQATRKTSGEVFKALCSVVPFLYGSADLAESTGLSGENNLWRPNNEAAQFNALSVGVAYGVREHAMGAIMNGIALHKGFRVCGSTFLVFSDYLRPALRLAALMELPVIYVLTHDSIGLGEDGPTHQPIEHLASLRAIPNLNVFRPADAIEVVECWQLALASKNTPSVLCLTRQAVPTLRTLRSRDESSEANTLTKASESENPCISPLYSHNACAKGAYVIKKSDAHFFHVDLWATGSEVSLACQVQKALEANGLYSRVISFPCWSLFEQQPQSYQNLLKKSSALKVAIEAAGSFGWERYVDSFGLIFGIKCFGISAPYQEIYKHFDLDCHSITQRIVNHLACPK